jgi:hypothetical protein
MKLINYLFILIPIFCYSQVEHIFYVEDVEYVEYLTVNFCVSDSGKTSSVTIVPEKTSYKNEDIINQVIAYRKGIEYFPDTKLKNNCYDYTFYFLNIKFQNSIIPENEVELCKNFKSGNFKYDNLVYSNTIIERTENFQIEKSKDGILKFKIDWIEPYKYNLTFLEVKNNESEYLIGETIQVEILKVINKNEYLYFSNLLDRTFSTGIIRKIN